MTLKNNYFSNDVDPYPISPSIVISLVTQVKLCELYKRRLTPQAIAGLHPQSARHSA